VAFQLKNFTSIAASMINVMKGVQTAITDFYVGSIVRTMLEAVAGEIEQLYMQAFTGLREAIPVSVYNSFNFPPLAQTTATGTVRVLLTPQTSVTVVGAGTVLTPELGGITYTGSADVTAAIGASYIDVPAIAAQPGAEGNIAAGVAFTLSPAPQGFISAASLAAFANGIDAETPEAQEVRFNGFIRSIQRGTVDAIKYGLTTVALTDANGNVIERVACAWVDEPYERDQTQPIALVNAYIHNGVGSTSNALLQKALLVISGYVDANGNKIPGYKAAGIPCNIFIATEVAVAISAYVTIASGAVSSTVLAQVSAALSNYILGLDVNQPCEVATLYALAMAQTGVTNFVPTAPMSDVAPLISQKLVPGAISLVAVGVMISAPALSSLVAGSASTISGTFANGAPTGLTYSLDGAAAVSVTGASIIVTAGSVGTASGTYSFVITAPAAGAHTLSVSGTGAYAATSTPTAFTTH
jgi:hypothetical protein